MVTTEDICCMEICFRTQSYSMFPFLREREKYLRLSDPPSRNPDLKWYIFSKQAHRPFTDDHEDIQPLSNHLKASETRHIHCGIHARLCSPRLIHCEKPDIHLTYSYPPPPPSIERRRGQNPTSGIIRIRIRIRFMALLFTNKERDLVKLVHKIEH